MGRIYLMRVAAHQDIELLPVGCNSKVDAARLNSCRVMKKTNKWKTATNALGDLARAILTSTIHNHDARSGARRHLSSKCQKQRLDSAGLIQGRHHHKEFRNHFHPQPKPQRIFEARRENSL